MDEALVGLNQHYSLPCNVTTDALTMFSLDLPKAKERFAFKEERGSWRTHEKFTLPEDAIKFAVEGAMQLRIDFPDDWGGSCLAQQTVI